MGKPLEKDEKNLLINVIKSSDRYHPANLGRGLKGLQQFKEYPI